MVRDPKDWPWSSYRTYAFGEESSLLHPNQLYEELGKTPEERQRRYRSFVLEPQDPDKENRFLKARFYGSEEFVKMMERRFGVERLPGRRGRPRKNRTVP